MIPPPQRVDTASASSRRRGRGRGGGPRQRRRGRRLRALRPCSGGFLRGPPQQVGRCSGCGWWSGESKVDGPTTPSTLPAPLPSPTTGSPREARYRSRHGQQPLRPRALSDRCAWDAARALGARRHGVQLQRGAQQTPLPCTLLALHLALQHRDATLPSSLPHGSPTCLRRRPYRHLHFQGRATRANPPSALGACE